MTEISAANLKDRISSKEDLYIIDVREAWEYDEENIGAHNIPLGELPEHLSHLPRDKEIFVHCQSGRRSAQAQKYLARHGFKAITLKGGLEAYINLLRGEQG